MAALINLTIFVALRHILDKVPELVSDDDSEDGDDNVTAAAAKKSSSRMKLVAKKRENSRRVTSEQLLDFEGPKLIHGVKNWLVYYQLMGQLNFTGKPLYVSIIFKLFVFLVSVYVFWTRYIMKLFHLHVVDGSFKNPIFLFISCLAAVGLVSQILITLYVNLLDLCPLYKILTTPKLCFLNVATQHTIGSKSLNAFIFMHIYTALLMSMAAAKSWSDFVNQFHLPTFLLEVYASSVLTYYLLGLIQMDLYIRCSFGHWLLALKGHLERQFTSLHRFQKRSMRFHGLGSRESLASSPDGISATTMRGNFATSSSSPVHRIPNMHLITLDEIQKNLNHMDDHLEVLRSIQISTIVLITLNAFLSNGSLFLLTYHLMADQSNYYHGFLFLLISINFILGIFLSYAGDRWVFYALSSFVQTVEDEYFMQSNIKALDLKPDQLDPNADRESLERLDEPLSHDYEANQLMQQILLIKKKDVLFCCEFLHQFENHLATPWSKLTFKSHLHMLRTFVTLIAAQIIFDHEH